MGYSDAWDLQRQIHGKVAAGDMPNALLLVEHPHVYTLGRRGSHSDILVPPTELDRMGIEVHEIDRGGEVTYHGPGQLVGYPIVNLRSSKIGPLQYVRGLEQTIVGCLDEFGIEAASENKSTGVWVGDAKIAAIGVRVSRGVTTHGFALNVGPDLSYFEHIVPCGTPDAKVTSMVEHGVDADIDAVSTIATRRLAETFQWDMKSSTLAELGERVGNLVPVA